MLKRSINFIGFPGKQAPFLHYHPNQQESIGE